MKDWIVIPAYNEERGMSGVLDGLKAQGYSNLIVVNDGSTDRTGEIARLKGAHVIDHPRNLGLGAALRTGLREALKRNAYRVVTFDADGQHDLEAVGELVKALDDADLVIGVRKHFGIPLHKRFGNFGLNLITFLFCGMLTDSQSGMRALSHRALEAIKIRSDRYAVSSEILIQTKKRGLRLKEVPVRCFYNKYSKARGTTIVSGIRIFLNLIFQRVKYRNR